jgi:hypothetical protein
MLDETWAELGDAPRVAESIAPSAREADDEITGADVAEFALVAALGDPQAWRFGK